MGEIEELEEFIQVGDNKEVAGVVVGDVVGVGGAADVGDFADLEEATGVEETVGVKETVGEEDVFDMGRVVEVEEVGDLEDVVDVELDGLQSPRRGPAGPGPIAIGLTPQSSFWARESSE